MPVFKEFDSFESMIEYMDEQTKIANAGLADEQKKLTYGSHFVNFDIEDNIVIFGYVFTEDENVASEKRAGASEDEAQSTLASVRDAHERGYLFGRCYSTVEPRGELGDTHRANAWPIPASLFGAACEAGWNVAGLSDEDVAALNQAYQGFRAHKLGQLTPRT